MPPSAKALSSSTCPGEGPTTLSGTPARSCSCPAAGGRGLSLPVGIAAGRPSATAPLRSTNRRSRPKGCATRRKNWVSKASPPAVSSQSWSLRNPTSLYVVRSPGECFGRAAATSRVTIWRLRSKAPTSRARRVGAAKIWRARSSAKRWPGRRDTIRHSRRCDREAGGRTVLRRRRPPDREGPQRPGSRRSARSPAAWSGRRDRRTRAPGCSSSARGERRPSR